MAIPLEVPRIEALRASKRACARMVSVTLHSISPSYTVSPPVLIRLVSYANTIQSVVLALNTPSVGARRMVAQTFFDGAVPPLSSGWISIMCSTSTTARLVMSPAFSGLNMAASISS